jgi:hypothetical protein
MGTSKRYAHFYDEVMQAKIAEGIMRTGLPETLDDKHLALDTEPMTRTPKPEAARAWVRLRRPLHRNRCRGGRLDKSGGRHQVAGARWHRAPCLGLVGRCDANSPRPRLKQRVRNVGFR